MQHREGYSIGLWNAGRGLSHPKKHAQIAEGIDALNVDVMTVVEAYDRGGHVVDRDFADKLGYNIMTLEYEDEQPHPSVFQFMALLTRKELDLPMSSIRLGSRNALQTYLPFGSKHVRSISGHMDDRNSALRDGMTDSLLRQLVSGEPTVLDFDFNNIHESDLIARVLTSAPVRGVTKLLPGSIHACSLVKRSVQMADGAVLAKLEDNNFVDADVTHAPTMKFAGRPVMQLDHFMYSKGLVNVIDHTVHNLPGSDHQAISALVSLP